ncbi:MAG: hypothetical protein ACWGSQ_13855, partial [Longimicrobiales bacterium]
MESSEVSQSLSLPIRLFKVFFSPGEVFLSLREKPVWLGAVGVCGVLVALSIILIPADIWVESMREQAARQGTEIPSFLASARPAFRL